MKSEERMEVWRKRIEACQSSGLSIAQWCRENKVNPSAYYHWRKRLSVSSPSFADPAGWVQVHVREEDRTSKSPILIRLGDVIIEVSQGFDPRLLHDVVRVLSQA